jgi:hypothetical protein
MFVWFRPFRHLLLALGLVCLLVGLSGLIVYLRQPETGWSNLNSSDLSTVETISTVSVAQLTADYVTGYKSVSEQLKFLMEKKLTDADIPSIIKVRDQLLALTVPTNFQTQHLQLVLKLGLLHELLKPTSVVMAAGRGAPTVAKTQQEVIKLLNI